MEKKQVNEGRKRDIILCRLVGGSFIESEWFEERPERGKKASNVNDCKKSIPNQGACKCKVPEERIWHETAKAHVSSIASREASNQRGGRGSENSDTKGI